LRTTLFGVPRTLTVTGPLADRWINARLFQPQGLRFGTSARTYTDLRADGLLNGSFGGVKRTTLTEKVTLTFRAEFFNAFNRTVFGGPQGNISNVNFGRVSSWANSPRQGQMALRVDF